MSNETTAIDRIQCKGHCGQTTEVPNTDGWDPSRCPECGSEDIASTPIEDEEAAASAPGPPGSLTDVMRALYDSEFDCGMQSFWDGGFEVWLGGGQNPVDIKESFSAGQYDDAAAWLDAEVRSRYPGSLYARRREVEPACQPIGPAKDMAAMVYDFILGMEPCTPENDYDRGYADACKMACAILNMVTQGVLLMKTADGREINPITDYVYTWRHGCGKIPSYGALHFCQASLRFEPDGHPSNPFFATREGVDAYINEWCAGKPTS